MACIDYWKDYIEILPPVTKKYDKRTIENINIADGCFTHPGLFSFRFGTSKTVNGILKIASMMWCGRTGSEKLKVEGYEQFVHKSISLYPELSFPLRYRPLDMFRMFLSFLIAFSQNLLWFTCRPVQFWKAIVTQPYEFWCINHS